MFNIGPAELLVIGLVLLIAVGPEQLPGVIRRVGSTVAQVRSMTDGLRSEFMAGLDEIERATDIERWSDDDDDSSQIDSSTIGATAEIVESDDVEDLEQGDSLASRTAGHEAQPDDRDTGEVDGADAPADGREAGAESGNSPGGAADQVEDGDGPSTNGGHQVDRSAGEVPSGEAEEESA